MDTLIELQSQRLDHKTSRFCNFALNPINLSVVQAFLTFRGLCLRQFQIGFLLA